MWHILPVEFYSILKYMGLQASSIYMDPEAIMLWAISHPQKDKYWVAALLYVPHGSHTQRS
jgi:hypothetical protein